MNQQVFELLLQDIKFIRDKVVTIEQNMVTKESCSKSRKLCAEKNKSKALDIKRIGAVGLIVTGALTAFYNFVINLVK